LRLEGDGDQKEEKKKEKKSDAGEQKKRKQQTRSPARASSSKNEKKKDSRKRKSEGEEKKSKPPKKSRADKKSALVIDKVHAQPASKSAKRPIDKVASASSSNESKKEEVVKKKEEKPVNQPVSESKESKKEKEKESKVPLLPPPSESEDEEICVSDTVPRWKKCGLFPGYMFQLTEDCDDDDESDETEGDLFALLSKDGGVTVERVKMDTTGSLVCGGYKVEMSIANYRTGKKIEHIDDKNPMMNVLGFYTTTINEPINGSCIYGRTAIFDDYDDDEDADPMLQGVNKKVWALIKSGVDVTDIDASDLPDIESWLNFEDGAFTLMYDANNYGDNDVGLFHVRMVVTDRKQEVSQKVVVEEKKEEKKQDDGWIVSSAIHPSATKTSSQYRLNQNPGEDRIDLFTLHDGSVSQVDITKKILLEVNRSVATIYLSSSPAFAIDKPWKFAISDPLTTVFGFLRNPELPAAPIVSDDKRAIQGMFDLNSLSPESLSFFSSINVTALRTDDLVLESKLDLSSGVYEIKDVTTDGLITLFATVFFRIKVE